MNIGCALIKRTRRFFRGALSPCQPDLSAGIAPFGFPYTLSFLHAADGYVARARLELRRRIVEGLSGLFSILRRPQRNVRIVDSRGAIVPRCLHGRYGAEGLPVDLGWLLATAGVCDGSRHEITSSSHVVSPPHRSGLNPSFPFTRTPRPRAPRRRKKRSLERGRRVHSAEPPARERPHLLLNERFYYVVPKDFYYN